MTGFRISVDMGHLISDRSPLTAELFPSLAQAVRAVSEAAHAKWQDYASGAPLPGGGTIEPRSGTYLRSIQLQQTGPFGAEVYSDLAYAWAIEEGAPARDMKRILGSSLKTRVVQNGAHKGQRYLIIPFRWFGEGTVAAAGRHEMPEAVQNWWHSQKPSQVTGLGWRDSGTGAIGWRSGGGQSWRTERGQVVQVRQRDYQWGTRLDKDTLASLGVTGQAARRMEGMVQFRKPGGRGGSSHSKSLTFRVMGEWSSGWQAPARPGLHPARTTAQEIQPDAEKAFAAAVARDMRRHLGSGSE
ncbi:conserved protein of unknown function (plasmid) [Rhodovastum atsumiense]|uniref:Uncharacterized protein n=1 Tax=Rhodovastum atsumiense TaxID=504468 RepID=A0A5M6ITE5_9PROT|nr:hypothetical protein [Rhodovastum atsumiense]KAA5611584.1 hypothetical protein F1189_13550 [Rhodovastum atsumiense]CAH2606333.1 conserved protein of unknown function [Rhodovastum atsumiense]